MEATTIKIDDSPIIKNALESLKHFENFEKLLSKAGMELRQSRSIQLKNRDPSGPHETPEDKVVWEIYDKLSEIHYLKESLKQDQEAED